jgi:hypothetical protein
MADLVERYDLDGIHLDYIRYQGTDFDYFPGTLAAFRSWAAPRLDAGAWTVPPSGTRWPGRIRSLSCGGASVGSR